MKILVGLGNPGKKYQNTRHNIGFAMIDNIHDELQETANFDDWSDNKKFQAQTSEGTINNEKIVLVKPLTFMNNSGLSVQSILNFYKETSKNLTVLHDEIDLTFGNFKIQTNKSAAGHNGIQSIIDQINSQDFTRIRIGIGKENKNRQGDTAKFVLNRFSLIEKFKLKELLKTILKEIENIL
jgi:peptidyl-tRNA hydrolase, PTH1 family